MFCAQARGKSALAKLRYPTLQETIWLFTAVVIGAGGVIGSGISVILGGGIIYNLAHWFRGRLLLPRNRQVRLVSAAFIFFFLAEAFSALVNYIGPLSLLEIFENIPFLAFPLFYGSMSRASRASILSALEVAAIAGAFGCLVVAVAETVALDASRADGLAGNPGPFALVCTLLYGIAVVVAGMRTERRRRLLALAAAAAAAVALLLSGLRTLWPMLVLAPLIVTVVLRPRLHGILTTRTILAAVLVLAAGAYLSYGTVMARIDRTVADYNRVVVEQDYGNSLGLRLIMWRAAVGLVEERPLLGHGPGREEELLAERTAGSGEQLSFGHFHNFVLQAWARSGVPGALAVLLMLAAPVWVARRPHDGVGRAGYALICTIAATYLLSGLLGIMVGHDIFDTLFVYGMVCGLYLVFGEEDYRPDAKAAVQAGS